MEESRKRKWPLVAIKTGFLVSASVLLAAVWPFNVPSGLDSKLSFLSGMLTTEVVIMRGHANGSSHIWSGHTYELTPKDGLFLAKAEQELKALGMDRIYSHPTAIEYQDRSTSTTVFISSITKANHTFKANENFIVTIGTAQSSTPLLEARVTLREAWSRIKPFKRT